MRCYIFEDHFHQSGLLRAVFDDIKTPLILWVEHDTPLVTDCPIPWDGFVEVLKSGDVNLIRLLHEARILEEHEYLMRDTIDSHGVPLKKTMQFSARPHIATVEFYRRLLLRFSPKARCFIEDAAYSICQSGPWEEWKMAIYTPEGNCKRSLHLDGRSGESKFDDSQIF
jgi:hypothetical protein